MRARSRSARRALVPASSAGCSIAARLPTTGTAIWRAARCRRRPPCSLSTRRRSTAIAADDRLDAGRDGRLDLAASASERRRRLGRHRPQPKQHQHDGDRVGDAVEDRRTTDDRSGVEQPSTRSGEWLRRAAGDITPTALRAAILRRYGKDRTFSVPILTVLALTGKLGDDAAGRLADRFRSCRSSWPRCRTPGFSICGCRS